MVSVGGLAGWFAASGEAGWGAAAFFFLLLIWEIAGRNLSNDLADLTHDRLVGIATLAATHGPRVAAQAIMMGAALMPLVGLLQDGSWPARVAIAAVAAVTMTWPAILLRRDPREPQAQRYFNRASLFPMGATACLVILAVVDTIRTN
jgi:4-hydroxybenzoate polyprenyltransferase